MSQSLAVSSLLEKPFLDRHGSSILLSFPKVLFHYFLFATITGQRFPSTQNASLTFKVDDHFPKIWTAQIATVPSMFQADLPAQFPVCGLCPSQNIPRLGTNHFTLIANGVTEVLTSDPFNARLSILFLYLVYFLKEKVIWYDFRALERIFTIKFIKARSL